jgi:hypothetical protein
MCVEVDYQGILIWVVDYRMFYLNTSMFSEGMGQSSGGGGESQSLANKHSVPLSSQQIISKFINEAKNGIRKVFVWHDHR